MFAPITLTGKHIILRPICFDDVYDLAQAGQGDAEIWNNIFYGQMHGVLSTRDEFQTYIENMLTVDAAKSEQTFAVVHRTNNRVIGVTRYMSTHKTHRWLEIGGTWYAKEARRTAINTESKFLLLSYAFEELRCVRVQFVADVRNERSQQAFERLGAVREVIARNHRVLPDGYRRSSVQYSILEEEWHATVRAKLIERLGEGYGDFITRLRQYELQSAQADNASFINLQYGTHRRSTENIR